MTTPASPFMTTDEVAAEIRMSRDYVSRQCDLGNLKATKTGKFWRIHRDDLARFMSGTTKLPASRPERRRAS